MTADQDFANRETHLCQPLEDPLNPHSSPASNLVEDLTLYKNYEMGVWNDCKNVIYQGLKVSDTPISLVASHSPCSIKNSLFIGESGNLGEPNEVRLRNGTKVMWHRYLLMVKNHNHLHQYSHCHVLTGQHRTDYTIKQLSLGSTSMTAGWMLTKTLSRIFTMTSTSWLGPSASRL